MLCPTSTGSGAAPSWSPEIQSQNRRSGENFGTERSGKHFCICFSYFGSYLLCLQISRTTSVCTSMRCNVAVQQTDRSSEFRSLASAWEANMLFTCKWQFVLVGFYSLNSVAPVFNKPAQLPGVWLFCNGASSSNRTHTGWKTNSFSSRGTKNF